MNTLTSAYMLDDATQAVIKNENGESYHINCYEDLKPYYAYISGKRGHETAQKMLENVFKGEKVMSELIERTQRGY